MISTALPHNHHHYMQLTRAPRRRSCADLNPIEKFWSWLRRELRRRDLQDYKQKKPALTKQQYIARVRQGLQTTKAQQVAKRIAGGFRKTCKEVDNKKGAAARS